MIESERLKIRPFQVSDFDTIFEWFFDSEVMKWIPGGPDSSPSVHRKRIEEYSRHFEKYGFSKYLLTDKSTGEMIGDAGILHLDETDMVELGYRIKTSRWRQGFATEACRSIIEHTFSKTRIREIHAVVEDENRVSVDMLEKKLQFRFLRHGIFIGVPMRLYRLGIEE